MTTRAEAKAEEQAHHKLQALVLVIICAAIAVTFIVFIAIMATHMPATLVDEEDVKGSSYTNVTMEWDHMVIVHTADMSLGDVDWEVTKGEDNETVASGVHKGSGDDHIFVTVDGSGKYGVYLAPTGVNSGVAYDVTVREYYLSPGLIESMRLAGFFFLALMVPLLWYAFRATAPKKNWEEYRLARIAIILTALLSAIFAFTPWV